MSHEEEARAAAPLEEPVARERRREASRREHLVSAALGSVHDPLQRERVAGGELLGLARPEHRIDPFRATSSSMPTIRKSPRSWNLPSRARWRGNTGGPCSPRRQLLALPQS